MSAERGEARRGVSSNRHVDAAGRCSLFFFSSRRRHTRLQGDWSSDVCSSDLPGQDIQGIFDSPRSSDRQGELSTITRASARIRVEYYIAAGCKYLHFMEKAIAVLAVWPARSEEHTSELQSPCNLVCRLLLEKK